MFIAFVFTLIFLMLVLNNYCLCITDREILSGDLFRCSIVNAVLKAIPFSYSFFY